LCNPTLASRRLSAAFSPAAASPRTPS
jgi:hypothetical protein